MNKVETPTEPTNGVETGKRQVKYKWKDQFKNQCSECIRVNMDYITRVSDRINFENQDLLDKSLSDFTGMIENIMSPFLKLCLNIHLINKMMSPTNLGSTDAVKNFTDIT